MSRLIAWVAGRFSDRTSEDVQLRRCRARRAAWRGVSRAPRATPDGRDRSAARRARPAPVRARRDLRQASVTMRAGVFSSSTGTPWSSWKRAKSARNRGVRTKVGEHLAKCGYPLLGAVQRPILALGIVEAMLPRAVLVRHELKRRSGVSDAPAPDGSRARSAPPQHWPRRERCRRSLGRAREGLGGRHDHAQVIQRARVAEHPAPAPRHRAASWNRRTTPRPSRRRRRRRSAASLGRRREAAAA